MQKFYYVYILVDITTETHHYTGVTEDLHARLAKHNAGEVPQLQNSNRGASKRQSPLIVKKKPVHLKNT